MLLLYRLTQDNPIQRCAAAKSNVDLSRGESSSLDIQDDPLEGLALTLVERKYINSDPSRQLAKPLIGCCNENILAVI